MAVRNRIDPTVYWDGDTFKSYSFAEEICEHYKFAATVKSDTLWWHNGQIWVREGEQLARQEIRAILRDTANQNVVNETVRNIKHITRSRREDIFDLPPYKLVVDNGLVNLKTGDFTHEAQLDYYPGTKTRLEVKYHDNAYPREFNQFLHDILHAQDVPIMWELIGYCLYRGYPFQKAALLVGDGANGKSTFVRTIREFLGLENVSTVELQELARDKFAVADLDGKLANLAADISADALNRTGKFKELTGEDLIRAQHKYEDSFKFQNKATLIFSANEPPAADDDTYAYERRWLYFEFPNTFSGDNAVPQEDLLEMFRREHAGILNMAIASFQQLWNRGGFAETQFERSHDKAHDRATNPAYEFASDAIERADNQTLRIKRAYEAFAAWCEQSGRSKQGKDTFKQTVDAEYAASVGNDPADQRYDVWQGLQLVGDGPDGDADVTTY